MRTVKMAFIGAGGIAQVHLRALKEREAEGIEVVAVCDLAYERAQQTALRWGIPHADDVELFRRENLAFAEAIREGLPSPIPPEQMLLTNVIIQGLIDSAQAGREVAVAVPEV